MDQQDDFESCDNRKFYVTLRNFENRKKAFNHLVLYFFLLPINRDKIVDSR